jgi:signal transduction histidine kinase/CheY-like chemotaxis protein
MKFWEQNITAKVASFFLLLSLLTVGGVGGVAFNNARDALKQAAFNRLSVTATLKEDEITRWFEDQERDFFLVTQFPDIQQHLKTILSTSPTDRAFQASHATLVRYLTDVATIKPNLSEISVLDRSNRIIVSTNPVRQGQYEILASITYLETIKPGDTFDPIFYRSPKTGKPAVTLATSLYDQNGRRQGLLLANLNLDRIDQIVRERSGLGESGETYLVGALGHENTFISRTSPLDPELAGSSSEGIDRAMQGISGSGLYRNYEGVPVIGIYRWLDNQDISLLVEMSQEEAFAPARNLAGAIMLVGLVAVGALTIGVSWLTRQLELSRQQLEDYSHQLEQKAQEASTANRAKSEFLANMSHELRTPLNAILGFTQLMVRDRGMNTTQMEHLQIINRSGEHLLTLINDVLEMSKIEAGQTTLNQSVFDLHHFLDALEDMLLLKAKSKGLKFSFTRSPNVPRYIQTDEGKLRQVLINLLGNAIKFTQVGEVRLRVNLLKDPPSPKPTRYKPAEPSSFSRSIEPPDQAPPSSLRSHPSALPPSFLQFEIADTGPGIAAAEIDSLFEPFVQAEVGRSSKQGTGLGLPISQRFVRLMGGDISVHSVVGQGTIFTFFVAVDVPANVAMQPQPRQQVVGIAPGQPTYRLLIVEDQWENRQLLVKMLQPLGFELREAENGKAGIEQWQQWHPHLIWMDMRMPIMDGYEATKHIKAHAEEQSAIIIALTASAFDEERSVILSSGCDDFVRKPVEEQTILEMLARHLGVRYQYADHPSSPAVTEAELPLTPQDFNGMPTAWIEQLHQAAMQVDADRIVQLLQEIPADRSTLTAALTSLTHQFCFDEIIELTQGDRHV